MKATTVLSEALVALAFCATAVAPVLLASSPIASEPGSVSPSQHLRRRPEVPDSERADEGPSVEGPWPLLGTLVNTHTDERMVLDPEAPSLDAWSELLRDRVTGSRLTLAPEPLGLLRRLAAQHPGARIELVSGFRSPKLNETLRKKGHHVASHSQHSLGHAVDFRLVGMTPAQLRAAVRGLGWKGGVGQYDKASDRFVHVDVGRDRSWRE